MKPIPSGHDRSVRRSRLRLAVLLALSSVGEGYVGQLARLTGISWARVRSALVGDPPSFRRELSLVAQGLAVEVTGREGRVFAITPAGRRKARSLVRAWSRRVGARERILLGDPNL